MTKQCMDKPQSCGTCKWRDIEHKYVWSPDDMAACLAPFPDSICGDTKLMHKTEGQDCQVYSERKDDRYRNIKNCATWICTWLSYR